MAEREKRSRGIARAVARLGRRPREKMSYFGRANACARDTQKNTPRSKQASRSFTRALGQASEDTMSTAELERALSAAVRASLPLPQAHRAAFLSGHLLAQLEKSELPVAAGERHGKPSELRAELQTLSDMLTGIVNASRSSPDWPIKAVATALANPPPPFLSKDRLAEMEAEKMKGVATSEASVATSATTSAAPSPAAAAPAAAAPAAAAPTAAAPVAAAPDAAAVAAAAAAPVAAGCCCSSCRRSHSRRSLPVTPTAPPLPPPPPLRPRGSRSRLPRRSCSHLAKSRCQSALCRWVAPFPSPTHSTA